VIEPAKGDKKGLRWFKDKGKTKNGHSIVLKLRYRGVTILLGGDLNIPAEKLLLEQHVGAPLPKAHDGAKRDPFLKSARKVFQADIAKSCHHGSADFLSIFLEAVNPIATLVSSGDEEPYAHPRADALGTIGRFGRGERPLIFSTEISRSGKETITHPFQIRRAFRDALDALARAENAKEREKALKSANKLVDHNIDRSVATYGAIQVRTDGEKVVIAYKIEAPRRKDLGWDIYLLEPDRKKDLRYLSKYIEPADGETDGALLKKRRSKSASRSKPAR
jgi:hypothetical protein